VRLRNEAKEPQEEEHGAEAAQSVEIEGSNMLVSKR
jgi:hypothetical protein